MRRVPATQRDVNYPVVGISQHIRRNLQLGSRARARYLLHYTSERMRSAYRELYLELAAAANIPLREPHPGAFAGKTAD